MDAIQTRIADWRHVAGRASSRRLIEGGLTLWYEHDEQLAAELARLAAAEFDCCSFFTFTLSIEPAGMAFTVTAPAEAGEIVGELFGACGPTGTAVR